MSAPEFARYGRGDGILLRFVAGPLDEAVLAEVDELFRTAFRLGRLEGSSSAWGVAADAVNEALREAGVPLLGSELFEDVSCWLGDGPCEDGSVLEALAGLHNEGVLNLGLPLRRQCTAAGFPIYRLGADGPSWAQVRAERAAARG